MNHMLKENILIKNKNDRPIGIFDSGLGGLTVLKTLMEFFPQESFIYFGDTARLPYGNKSAKTILNYSNQIILFLLKQNVKTVIVACNSASTVASEIKIDIPLFNVIEPGAKSAVNYSKNSKIGVIGTKTTISSNSYYNEIKKQNPNINIYSNACPLMVSLAEEGWIEDPITNLIVYRYLHPLVEKEIDTLILGCTHFPILRKSIEKVVGSSIYLVDSGMALAKDLAIFFKKNNLLRDKHKNGSLQIYTTDNNQHFLEVANLFLYPMKIKNIKQIDINTNFN